MAGGGPMSGECPLSRRIDADEALLARPSAVAFPAYWTNS